MTGTPLTAQEIVAYMSERMKEAGAPPLVWTEERLEKMQERCDVLETNDLPYGSRVWIVVHRMDDGRVKYELVEAA